MSTRRVLISRLRNKIKEVNADTIYTNKFLYYSILEHSIWIIKREYSSNRIFQNKLIFQKLPCLKTKEVNKVDCPEVIEGNNIYRTICKLPKMWETDLGPIIYRLSSIDNSTNYTVLTSSQYENRQKSPYKKLFKEKYAYYEDGYFWFTENPKRITLRALFLENPSKINCDCEKKDIDCTRFLDESSGIPEYLEAEILSKCVQQILGETERKQNDEEINSNTTRRN